MTEVDMIRNNLEIDPHLHFWGWEIPVYLFLGGISAGIMILSSLMRLRGEGESLSRWFRWMPFATPIALSVGMGALFLDLAHKAYVFRFYLTFRPFSPMSWGAWILLAIYPATLLLGLLGLKPEELEAMLRWKPLQALPLKPLARWASDLARRNERALLWINLILGVGLGAYTGLLIGTLAARPAWNSIMLAPLFLVSGISTGAALMMLFPMHENEKHALRQWDVAAIVAELVLLGLFLLSLSASGGEAGRYAAWLFVGGPFTTAFFTLVIFGGLLTPLLLEVMEARHHLRPTLMAPILILMGGLSLRWVLLLAGQA